MSEKKPSSIAKATGSVAILTLVSRILGLGREALLANVFGAGMYSDAFFVAFRIPNLLRRFVAEGSLSTAFVPIFSEELHTSKEKAKASFAAVLSFSLLVTGIFTVLGLIYSDEITLFFAPGFGDSPEKLSVAADMLQIMFPYIIFVSLLAVASGVLNTLGYFAIPAGSQAILNVVMIFFLLFLNDLTDPPIKGQAWSVTIGGLLAFLPLLIPLHQSGFLVGLGNPFRNPSVRKVLTLMIPSVLSSSLYQVMIFVNTFLASTLEEGSVSWLYYADRLFQFPLGVFSLALATAMLPALSRSAASGDNNKMQAQLSDALIWVSLITIPATAGLIMLAEPVIRLIYERGAFDSYQTAQTTSALVCFSIGLWPISLQSIVVRAFFAKKDTLTPTIVTSITLSTNVLLAIALMGTPVGNYASKWGQLYYRICDAITIYPLAHSGLALAGSISTAAATIALSLLLPRVSVYLPWKNLSFTVGKMLIPTLLMGLFIETVKRFVNNDLLLLLVTVPLGALIFLYSCKVVKIREAEQVEAALRAKLSRFGL